MKYLVDAALCSGHGLCALTSGDVYDIDDEGYNRDSGNTVYVAEGREASAQRGAESCPDQAIRILV